MRSVAYLLLLSLALGVQAHGVDHILLTPGHGVQFSYDNGDPLAFADIEIYSPADADLEYQIGMTDAVGAFMFRPDTTGPWTIKVSDGLGHGKVVTLEIGGLEDTALSTADLPRWKKIMAGLGYILFIFSIWGFYASWKRSRHAHS